LWIVVYHRIDLCERLVELSRAILSDLAQKIVEVVLQLSNVLKLLNVSSDLLLVGCFKFLSMGQVRTVGLTGSL